MIIQNVLVCLLIHGVLNIMGINNQLPPPFLLYLPIFSEGNLTGPKFHFSHTVCHLLAAMAR